MAKSIIEQLKEIDTELASKIDAAIAKHPKLAVDDRQMTELFGIYLGAEEPAAAAAATTEPTTTTTQTVTHTPAVPSAAATTSTPAAAATTTTASTADSAAILAALNGLKSSVESRLANVITKDDVPKLGADLAATAAAQALRQSNELAVIRETFRDEFPGEKFDSAAFEKFVLDAQDATTKRNKYPTLTDAFNAMVGQKRIDKSVATQVADQVKQKLSGTTVPGQTTSTALSPAQQVIAKAKKDGASGGGTNLQNLIDRAAQLERSREASTVQ